MPLFNIDLVSNPLCEDQALTLFKVDRVRTFLVLLELKTHHSLIDYYFTSYFGIIFLDLGLLMGNPPLCFFVICNFFIESNSYLPKKKKKKQIWPVALKPRRSIIAGWLHITLTKWRIATS